jgi:hypothetical protein
MSRASLEEESLSLSVYTPNHQEKIEWLPRLPTAVEGAKDAPGGSPTVALPLCKVKVTQTSKAV